MPEVVDSVVKLKVTEALAKDAGRKMARIDPADLAALGVEIGQVVELVGKRKTVVKAMPAFKADRGEGRLQVDGITRENLGSSLDQLVEVRKVVTRPADRVVISPINVTPNDRDLNYIGSLFDGLPVVSGDQVRVNLFGNRSADFKVASTTPLGASSSTRRPCSRSADPSPTARGPKAETTARTALVRGYRRTQARAAPDPRDHRASAALSRGLRAAGDRRTQGRACFMALPAAARP